MKLSPHEVAWLAQQVGFTNDPCAGLPAGTVATEAEVFVAVCCGESGLDTEVMARSNTSPPGANQGNRDHGLAQVSGKWQWDKIRAEGGRWRDPLVNARIGYRIFVAADRTFQPWSIFTSGGWLPYLPDARIGAAHPWPYVDPMQALIAERDSALSKLAAAQKQAADAISSLNVANTRLAAQETTITGLQTDLSQATARLARIRSDLG